MNGFAQKLGKYMSSHNIEGDHLIFEQSCHSVKEAAQAVNATSEDFVKNICFLTMEGELIVAIVKGEDRVSTSRIGKALKMKPPQIATPEEILAKTGYPCGGVPSFGYQARFLIDPRVMEKEVVYSGGGAENALVKISPLVLQKANRGEIIRVRK